MVLITLMEYVFRTKSLYGLVCVVLLRNKDTCTVEFFFTISVYWNLLNGILFEEIRDDLYIYISVYDILCEGDIDDAYKQMCKMQIFSAFHLNVIPKEMHVIDVYTHTQPNHMMCRNAEALHWI